MVKIFHIEFGIYIYVVKVTGGVTCSSECAVVKFVFCT